MIQRFTLFTVLLILLVLPLGAEELSAGISRDKIEIHSSFTGTEVAIFGTIEPEIGETVDYNRGRDIVVVVRSDRASVATVRKKELVGPIYINREARTFASVPEFYFVSSNRALKEIAQENVLQQFELGFENLAIGPAPGVVGGPPAFRKAFLNAQQVNDLYAQHEGAVTFMSTSLFRTTLSLPPNVPAGNLRVSVYAFKDGQVTSSSSMTLFVDKTGIERSLSDLAINWPVLYGVSAICFSVLAGFLAAVAFRERQ